MDMFIRHAGKKRISAIMDLQTIPRYAIIHYIMTAKEIQALPAAVGVSYFIRRKMP